MENPAVLHGLLGHLAPPDAARLLETNTTIRAIVAPLLRDVVLTNRQLHLLPLCVNVSRLTVHLSTDDLLALNRVAWPSSLERFTVVIEVREGAHDDSDQHDDELDEGLARVNAALVEPAAARGFPVHMWVTGLHPVGLSRFARFARLARLTVHLDEDAFQRISDTTSASMSFMRSFADLCCGLPSTTDLAILGLPDQNSPIGFACLINAPPPVILALLQTAQGRHDLGVADESGFTPLMYALSKPIALLTVLQGALVVLERATLLAVLDQRTTRGTALITACIVGAPVAVRLLLHYGADPNLAMDDDAARMTPLHVACYYGHVDCVDALLSNSSTDVRKVNSKGMTASDMARARIALHTGLSEETREALVECVELVEDAPPPS